MAKGEKGMDDPRFSKVFSDPRFRTVKKKDLKVTLDDRFNKKDLKKEFSLLKSTAKVDKYGRAISKDDGSSVIDNLDKYYKDEHGEEEEEGERKADDDDDDDDDDESGFSLSSSEGEEAETDPLAKARGLAEDNTSASELDSSDEEVSELEETVSSDVAETEDIPEQDPTTRIAAVNLDWDHLNSTDLFATFSSFLPQDGHIKCVTIYKSEYGKQRIADEELNGPPREIFKESLDNNEDEDDEDEDDEELDLAKASKKLIQENNGEEEGFDSSELRKYQLQRLRYYYAIVELNSLSSAKEIYEKCDNTEYESSGNFFDLRYVPTDMEFDDADIRDLCEKLPPNYQPIEFSTDSLRNSKPKLTWDETPIERVQILSKSFKKGELDDLDLKNYLASDSDEEAQDENISKYKQLVDGSGLDKVGKAGEEDSDSSDVDMEFTFTPGKAKTEDSSEKKRGKGEESTIEKLREKEKERRRARKQKVKELKRDAQSNKNKGKKNRPNTDEHKEDDLEIEQIGTEGKELHHFNIKDFEKLEKLKAKKNKFKNKRQRELQKELESRMEDSNQGNLEVDDRFAEMIDSHAFVGGSKLLQQERKKRKKMSNKVKKKIDASTD